MRIAILGYGVEGKSALKFLKSSLGGRAAKYEIEVRDVKRQGKNYLKGLEKFDMVVRSPGIPYLTPEIQKAKKAGVEITSATKLFFSAVGGSAFGGKYARGKIVGITGTKGKGTTAALLYKILKASGKKVFLAGNMGRPMLDSLPKLKKNSISILELSSFQLQDLDCSPDIAVILDISPDHLNYHRNFREYLNAKARIVGNPPSRREMRSLFFPPPLRREGVGGRVFPSSVFYFSDNKYAKLIAQKSYGKKIAVSTDQNLILKLPGFHNLKNASMAAAVAGSLCISQGIIKKTTQNFKGLPHRLEFVRKIGGVRYYNDSSATNPAATVAALSAFDAPKILIAGGQSKGLSFKPLRRALKNSNTKFVLLFGKNKLEIKKAIAGSVPVKLVSDLKSAVSFAGKISENGDIVLLSPASTAFGEFSGYAERGELFKNLVRLI